MTDVDVLSFLGLVERAWPLFSDEFTLLDMKFTQCHGTVYINATGGHPRISIMKRLDNMNGFYAVLNVDIKSLSTSYNQNAVVYLPARDMGSSSRS